MAKPKKQQPRNATWDPAASPSLAEQEERQFHATHFTADPRGTAAGSTAPPGKRRTKKRGGTPPAHADASDDVRPPARQKRRGGAGPG